MQKIGSLSYFLKVILWTWIKRLVILRDGVKCWWEPIGGSGHVVFVNEVRDYGNTVVITEYNFLSLNAYESQERVLQRYGAAQNSRKFPSSFIHVQTKQQ